MEKEWERREESRHIGRRVETLGDNGKREKQTHKDGGEREERGREIVTKL